MKKIFQRKTDEIIKDIARKSGIDEDTISEVIAEMYKSMRNGIANNENINIIGFGKFAVSKRKVEEMLKRMSNES